MELEHKNYSMENALDGKGPLVRLTIEKTKVAPYWLNESIDLYLPVHGTWHQLSDWPEIPSKIQRQFKIEDLCDSDPFREFADLPPDERKAMEFIYPRKGGIKREELDKHCDWEKQKSLDVLNTLIDKGLVTPEGEGKGRIYKPCV